MLLVLEGTKTGRVCSPSVDSLPKPAYIRDLPQPGYAPSSFSSPSIFLRDFSKCSGSIEGLLVPIVLLDRLQFHLMLRQSYLRYYEAGFGHNKRTPAKLRRSLSIATWWRRKPSDRSPANCRKTYGNYLMILVTRPEPTVRPPSRIAKPRPSSIAMG